jgi:rhodanese-related sulfurtransferase
MGYTNVAHYPEGKQGWMEAGLPVGKSAERITCTIW